MNKLIWVIIGVCILTLGTIRILEDGKMPSKEINTAQDKHNE